MIADIHFQPKYVYAAIDAGCAAVRVNPGRRKCRKFDDQIEGISRAAEAAGVSIRIGVNAGSLDKRLLEKYGKATPEALMSPPCGRLPVRGTISTISRSPSSAQRPSDHGAGLPAAR